MGVIIELQIISELVIFCVAGVYEMLIIPGPG
jgi:hypothetical protein